MLGTVKPLRLRPYPHYGNHPILVGRCYIVSLMGGGTSLGLLPDSRQFECISDKTNRIYVHKGRNSTLDDPALGSLLPYQNIKSFIGSKREEQGLQAPGSLIL